MGTRNKHHLFCAWYILAAIALHWKHQTDKTLDFLGILVLKPWLRGFRGTPQLYKDHLVGYKLTVGTRWRKKSSAANIYLVHIIDIQLTTGYDSHMEKFID